MEQLTVAYKTRVDQDNGNKITGMFATPSEPNNSRSPLGNGIGGGDGKELTQIIISKGI